MTAWLRDGKYKIPVIRAVGQKEIVIFVSLPSHEAEHCRSVVSLTLDNKFFSLEVKRTSFLRVCCVCNRWNILLRGRARSAGNTSTCAVPVVCCEHRFCRRCCIWAGTDLLFFSWEGHQLCPAPSSVIRLEKKFAFQAKSSLSWGFLWCRARPTNPPPSVFKKLLPRQYADGVVLYCVFWSPVVACTPGYKSLD